MRNFPRSSSVVICGLWQRDKVFATELELRAGGAELWTMNDFYLVYPKWRFERSFQIHYEEYPGGLLRNRWLGDWKREYNLRGVEAVVTRPFNGLHRRHLMEMDSIGAAFPPIAFSASLGYMFYEAERLGFRTVRLFGTHLCSHNREYDHEIPCVLWWIDRLRAKGVKVLAPREAIWRQKLGGVDWANLLDVKIMYHEIRSSTDTRLTDAFAKVHARIAMEIRKIPSTCELSTA